MAFIPYVPPEGNEQCPYCLQWLSKVECLDHQCWLFHPAAQRRRDLMIQQATLVNQRLADKVDAHDLAKETPGNVPLPQEEIFPAGGDPLTIRRFVRRGPCHACGTPAALWNVFVSSDPEAAVAGGPWCEACCDQQTRQWHQSEPQVKELLDKAALAVSASGAGNFTFSQTMIPPPPYSLGDMACLEEYLGPKKLVREEPHRNRWIGTVEITRFELEDCEDRRALRRLVSEKLQPLGDALLAALEKLVAEKET